MSEPIHTNHSLSNDLSHAGIVEGDTLLVHSSMKKIGKTEDGADGVIHALQQTLTNNGLLIFPAFSYISVTDLTPDFNVRTTPSCTGIISELFRHYPDVERSIHPFHSLTAWGGDSKSFTAGHEMFETSFDRNSPWGRLLERNAKVLLAGVDLTSATFLHAVEQWSGVPVLSREPVIRYIVNGNTRKEMKIFWHTGAHSENYMRAESLLLESGAMKKIKFGSAESYLLDCQKTWQLLQGVLQKNPDFFAYKSS